MVNSLKFESDEDRAAINRAFGQKLISYDLQKKQFFIPPKDSELAVIAFFNAVYLTMNDY